MHSQPYVKKDLKKMRLKLLVTKRQLLAVIGIGLLIWNSICLYIIFLIAFFNNGTITIIVNRYGEEIPEFILLPITLILGGYSFIYLIKKKETV